MSIYQSKYMNKHFLLKMVFILMKFSWFFDLANANIILNISVSLCLSKCIT